MLLHLVQIFALFIRAYGYGVEAHCYETFRELSCVMADSKENISTAGTIAVTGTTSVAIPASSTTPLLVTANVTGFTTAPSTIATSTGADNVMTGSDATEDVTGEGGISGQDTSDQDEQDSVTLKKQQTTRVSNLTRKRNAIVRLMFDSDNLPDVKQEVAVYDDLFGEYQETHASLMESLQTESARAHEAGLFTKNETEIRKFRQEVSTWISDSEAKLTKELETLSRLRSGSSRRSGSSSRHSRTSLGSALAHAKADLAALKVKREMLTRQERLEQKKQALIAEENLLQIESKISETVAKSQVYIKELHGDKNSDIITDRVDSADHIDSAVRIDSADCIDSAVRIDSADRIDSAVRIDSADRIDSAVRIDSADRIDSAVHIDSDAHVVSTGTHNGILNDNIETVTVTVCNVPSSGYQNVDSTHVYANAIVKSPVKGSECSVQTICHDFTASASQTAHLKCPVTTQCPAPVPVSSVSQQQWKSQDSQPQSQDSQQRYTPTSSVSQQQCKSQPLSQQRYTPMVPTDYQLNAAATPFRPSQPQGNMSIIQELVSAVCLPQPDVPKFSGDPTEFHNFIMAFDTRIASKTSSCSDRLYFLNQYLEGESKELIAGCLHMDPLFGYSQARGILENEYGSSYKISSTYIDRILSWPAIKHDDTLSLRKFAIFLKKCQVAMDSIPDLSILNHLPNLQAIVAKLPGYLQNRWREQANYVRSQGNRPIQFLDLTAFIESASASANDPIFGSAALSKYTTSAGKATAKSRLPTPKRSYGTTATQPTVPITEAVPVKHVCLLCHKGHHLNDCFKFLSKSMDDRRNFIKSKKACFGCLGLNHMSKGCINKLICNICNKNHPSSLHVEGFTPSKPSNEQQVADSSASVSTGDSAQPLQTYSCSLQDNPVVLQPIIPVRVQCVDSGKNILTYAFLDNGSNACFLSQELLNQLGTTGQATTLKLRTMSGETQLPSVAVNNLTISSYSGENAIRLPKCFSREEIPVSNIQIPRADILSRFAHLQEATDDMPAYMPHIPVGLLIGNNCTKALEPQRVIPSTGTGPFAVKYLHGWTINGPLQFSQSESTTDSAPTVFRVDVQEIRVKEIMTPNDMLRLFDSDFGDLESLSTTDKLGPSKEDTRFLKMANTTAELVNGHFVLPLPFREPDVCLPPNRDQAVKRAAWQRKKMLADDKYKRDYVGFISKLLENGYARKIPRNEITTAVGKVWYLPHHGVYHPTKKKIRVVFDCSAKFQDQSLNDHLLQGPNLTNLLLGVLLRFRLEPVAFIGDIEAMFHQVHVIPEHQNFLRFLWWPHGNLSADLEEYAMTVHLFGASSSPSIANYALKRTADIAEQRINKEVAETIRANFYVDDCLKSVPSVSDAIRAIQDLQSACRLGGFKIAKFCSNSPEVLASIRLEDRSKDLQTHSLDCEKLPSERALGVYWDVNRDCFGFSFILKQKPMTRRGILSIVSSVYDPLGFVAPYVLHAKHILRELCAEKDLKWDDPIPSQYVSSWNKWMEQLPTLKHLQVNRCVKPAHFGEVISTQLHIFSDASLIGYGAVVYMRLVNEHGDVSCSFMMGKARLTPQKRTTIPRLELTAATVAVRLGRLVRQELNKHVDEMVYYTDSTTVLQYIQNEKKKFPIFIGNRVQFILDRTSVTDWRYIESEENPADFASRGMYAKDIVNDAVWINAPVFLRSGKSLSSVLPPALQGIEETEILSAAVVLESQPSATDKLLGYFSDWFKLKHAVSVFSKVCTILKDRVHHHTGNYSISVQDMASAESAILKYVQHQCFPEDIKSIAQTGNGLPKDSHIRKLDPYMKQGLLRVGGRLGRSTLQESVKHPILLPPKHHVTRIIIQHIHKSLAHAGRNHVLAHLRETYWVIHANSAVRNVLCKCVTCRKAKNPVVEQKMADLPQERCTEAPPFTYTGVDLFGPFVIKQGRKDHKRYGVLFTCLACRAIHIEIAASLDTDSFLLALRRFIARRGTVLQLRCDNGTNFVGAERELREALAEMKTGDLQQRLLKQNIQWIFNPPAGSHFGGVWERQIRSVRKVLSHLSMEFGSVLDDESFHTLMCEVENIINSRPITTPSSDPTDTECLMPSHILHMKRGIVLPPPGTFQREDIYLRKRWRRVQYVANIFWTRWRKEYLLTLQNRQKWTQQRRNICVGDIVIIKDDAVARSCWSMARVTRTESDRKGTVRVVTVRTATTSLRRPIDRLVLLLPVEEQ